MNSHFAQSLHEFGQRIDIQGVRLDEQGHCLLSFDAVHVHIQWLDDEGQVVLYSPLGQVHADTPTMAWELLHANFLFQETGGASLSRNKETGQCVLSSLFDGAHMTTNALEERLTRFVNTAEFWMHRLQGADSTSTPSAQAVSEPPAASGWTQQIV